MFAGFRFSFGKSSPPNTQLSIHEHVTKHLKMTLNLLKIFVATILITSCNSQKDSGKITISGKLLSSKSKTIYLNKIDHFDYFNDKYTIDSTSVSENGDFKFNSQNLNSELVSISTEKFKPFTYQIFSAAPQTYYY